MSSAERLPIHSSNFIGSLLRCCGKKELTLSDNQLFFQLTFEGVRTQPQIVTVTNTGVAEVKIRKVVLQHGKDDFTLVNAEAYPAFLARGEKFNIVVDFIPRVDGKAIGLVEIYTNEERLPYIIELSSRSFTEDPDLNNDIHDRIFDAIKTTNRVRGEEDTRIKQEGIADTIKRIGVEVTNRINAINAEAGLRKQADLNEQTARIKADANEIVARSFGDANEAAARQAADALEAVARAQGDAEEARLRAMIEPRMKAYADLLMQSEVAVRFATDQDLYRLIAQIRYEMATGVISVEDAVARASIIEERIVRITADEAEAIARRTLEASFNTAISDANAKIVEESRVYASRYEAIASRTITLEANFVSRGEIESIADAKIRVEQIARATAISAETTLREQLSAELNTTIRNGLETEVIQRSAAILAERQALVTLQNSVASNILELTARTTNARGLTPNGTFAAGRSYWISGMDFVQQTDGTYIPTTRLGEYNSLRSQDKIYIDPSRVYQINALLRVLSGPSYNYVGMECYSADNTFLGNLYATEAGGQPLNGAVFVRHYVSGTKDMPVPSYYVGNFFPTGISYAYLIVLGNYPNPVSIENSQTQSTLR